MWLNVSWKKGGLAAVDPHGQGCSMTQEKSRARRPRKIKRKKRKDDLHNWTTGIKKWGGKLG